MQRGDCIVRCEGLTQRVPTRKLKMQQRVLRCAQDDNLVQCLTRISHVDREPG